MPAPDPYATCPGNQKVLAYYAGTFDSVYVSLSPFIQPMAIAPSVFCSEPYPSRQKVAEACKSVTWREIMSLTGLPSLSQVDIGLRTRIGGLNKHHENKEFADRITNLADTAGIIPPAEGEHSDFLHNQVLGLFQELGHEWVWVGDEFCTERRLHWIEDLKTEMQPTIQGHCNVLSPDKSILWTVHWDSHFSFICSSQENLNRLGIARRLEGFFCNPNTGVYWSLHET